MHTIADMPPENNTVYRVTELRNRFTSAQHFFDTRRAWQREVQIWTKAKDGIALFVTLILTILGTINGVGAGDKPDFFELYNKSIEELIAFIQENNDGLLSGSTMGFITASIGAVLLIVQFMNTVISNSRTKAVAKLDKLNESSFVVKFSHIIWPKPPAGLALIPASMKIDKLIAAEKADESATKITAKPPAQLGGGASFFPASRSMHPLSPFQQYLTQTFNVIISTTPPGINSIFFAIATELQRHGITLGKGATEGAAHLKKTVSQYLDPDQSNGKWPEWYNKQVHTPKDKTYATYLAELKDGDTAAAPDRASNELAIMALMRQQSVLQGLPIFVVQANCFEEGKPTYFKECFCTNSQVEGAINLEAKTLWVVADPDGNCSTMIEPSDILIKHIMEQMAEEDSPASSPQSPTN